MKMQELKREMLKKLTVKAIMGEKVKAPEVMTELFTIYGIADGIKKGETQYGEWIGLTGRFEAVKGDTLYASTVAFIPEPLHSMIAGAVTQPDAEAVQFGCKVHIKPRPDLPIGYEYIAEPLVEQTENDPLSALRGTVHKTLSLDAPKDKTAKAK